MSKRLGLALLAFACWTAITILLGRELAGEDASLLDTVTRGIGWPWALAAAFILAVVLWQGWSDVGLNRAAQPRSWRLCWLPMIYIVGGLGIATAVGLPPLPVMALVLVNCMLVGFSEELMFRGALLQAFRHEVPIWPAVILTSLAFGAIHSLNVFITGELWPALLQSTAAFLSGLMFIALRLRTGSLWPPIILHGLWDFATFTLGAASEHAASGTAEAATTAGPGLAALAPVLLVLPNAIYGFWLMRGIGRTHASAKA
jgi:membrane protease YdiL (CAAX protease family)